VAAEFAKTAGLHPYPLVVAVMVAVSTSPLTPLANKVDLLIMGPGGYRYGDFLKLGIPFTLLMGALSTLAIPLFFPFH
jgi:di/tricarboxylate transporter